MTQLFILSKQALLAILNLGKHFSQYLIFDQFCIRFPLYIVRETYFLKLQKVGLLMRLIWGCSYEYFCAVLVLKKIFALKLSFKKNRKVVAVSVLSKLNLQKI